MTYFSALAVPIFNIDKRPFALLCAYNASSHTNRFLEGHELSYLRAIGVIILSAVLKRRMILADKAKSLFISNISHELRTPLHGILAAAELLTDTSLNANQTSFLQTVQACGTSLVETVNHVLDFTKLSGSSKNGGVENVITPTK
jgi:signal transduction histidine kinase